MSVQLTENKGGWLRKKAPRRWTLVEGIAFGSGFTPGRGVVPAEFRAPRRTGGGTGRPLAWGLVTE